MHRKYRNLIWLAPVAVLGIVGSFGFICPYIPAARAEGGTQAQTETDSTKRVPYINLAKLGTATPEGTLKPTSGSTASTTITSTFKLQVNNAERYDVYVSTEDASLRAEGVSTTIDAMGSGVVAAQATDIPANKWGIRGAVAAAEATNLNTNFEGVPYVDTALKSKINNGTATDEEKAAYKASLEASAKRIGGEVASTGGMNPGYFLDVERIVTLQVGATAGSNLAAGRYSGEVIVSAVATPRELTIFDISTMQDMTHAICERTPTPTRDATVSATDLGEVVKHLVTTNYEGLGEEVRSERVPEVTLSDTRAGQTHTYLVRKLADGNCWMAQNLQLDFLGTGQDYATASTADANDYTIGTEISAGFMLTSNDTDIPAGADGTVASWAPSSSVYTTWATIIGARIGDDSGYARYGWKDDGSDGLRSYSYPGTVANCLSNSTNLGTDVCDNDVNTWGGVITGDGTLKVYFNNTRAPYGEYANLYNWTAATLGTGLTDSEAASSICPKGWRLPSNGTDRAFENNATNEEKYNEAHSFRNLVHNAYGLGNDTSDADSLAIFRAAPLNFLPTGLYNRSIGNILASTGTGRWWSSTPEGDDNAYHLYSNGNRIRTEFISHRGLGLAVRCIAR